MISSRITFWMLAATATLLVGVAVVLAQSTKPRAEELFSKQIALGQKIVVVREPADVRDMGVLARLMAPQEVHASVVRVECRVDGRAPVVLASAVGTEFPDYRKGFNVLGIVTRDNELVVTCTVRDFVGLWRISLDLQQVLPDGWAWLWPGQNAASQTLAKDAVQVTLDPLPDRQWAVKILDRRSGELEVYTQRRYGWDFELARPNK